MLLAGREIQRVQSVRDSDDRGRHTTTSRQMMLLPEGGIVIDTPGMREIGMWETETGLSKTFHDLKELANECRFRDCRHAGEPGCAVQQAVQDGTLSSERLESYHKLEAEMKYLESKTNSAIRQASKAHAKRASRALKKLYKDRS